MIVEKSKKIPQWSPETLEGVTDNIVDRFFAVIKPEKGSNEYLNDAPELKVPLEQRRVSPLFRDYALPHEDEIASMVKGAHHSGGGTTLTFEELIAKFEALKEGKSGVRQKVAEVAARKCEVIDNKDGNFVWLRWK